jgi:hypothetical protein
MRDVSSTYLDRALWLESVCYALRQKLSNIITDENTSHVKLDAWGGPPVIVLVVEVKGGCCRDEKHCFELNISLRLEMTEGQGLIKVLIQEVVTEGSATGSGHTKEGGNLSNELVDRGRYVGPGQQNPLQAYDLP